MTETFPNSLKPGSSSPSITPHPESAARDSNEMSRQSFSYAPGQEPQNQSGMNYGPRFPSQQLFNTAQSELAADSPARNSARPRMSMSGQSFAPGSDQSPPQALLAQHSGQAGSSSPRLASRPAQAPSQAMNPSVLQPGFSSTPNTRPGTAGGSGRSNGAVKSPFTAPVRSPPRSRPSQILLINPTSSIALTNAMFAVLRPILPPQLEVVGYTAPYPAPTATETTVDQALSTELVLRDLAKYATNNGETVQNFDAMLVASFTAHPLINALKESYDVPVTGIMEGSLYVSRMLGARFGILATTNRHKIQIDDAVRMSGLDHYYVGCEAVHMSPLEILGAPSQSTTGALPEEMTKRLGHAARSLVNKGADTLIMGSESMSNFEVMRAAKDAIREEDGRRTVNVVDCVEAGVMCLNALVGMGVPTSKKGVFRGEREGRRARGQNWL